MDRPGKNGGILRSFEKGQSGNPAGRPKSKPSLISQIIIELGDWHDLEICLVGEKTGQRPVAHQLRYSLHGEQCLNAFIAFRLLTMAMDGNIEAIQIILDRTEGRVPPSMLSAGQDISPMVEVIFYDSKQVQPKPLVHQH